MTRLMPHLIVAPVLIPMLAAGVMLLLAEHRRPLKLILGMLAAVLGVAVSAGLLAWVHVHGPVAYFPGNWPPPFGIALAVDRFSAAMLLLAWVLGLSAFVFSSARWHRAGVHFPALFQVQLMGLSGAFLTADVFNLFVFFEITLAASYGLLLHGSGASRVRASVHYVAMNLAASSLFLIGVAVIYGVTGTLNMAALAARVSSAATANRHLIHAGASILAVAFLIKAAAWPLNFWLVPAYSAATPPVAAVFALLTKVGIYALVRLWTLLFAGGPLAGFGANALLGFGLLTAVLAGLGMIASPRMAVQVACAVIVSAGTLLAALGLGDELALGSALFYLVASVLATGVFFLLTDLIERWKAGATVVEQAPFLTPTLEANDVNLDDEEQPLVGWPLNPSTALLALAFLLCTLLVAGLPPLPTFLGKLGMLSAALDQQVLGARSWLFVGVVLGCSQLTLVALTRTGIRTFWAGKRHEPQPVRAAEAVPVVVLLLLCVVMTITAGTLMTFARATARSLHDPAEYVGTVLTADVHVPAVGEHP